MQRSGNWPAGLNKANRIVNKETTVKARNKNEKKGLSNIIRTILGVRLCKESSGELEHVTESHDLVCSLRG